MSEKQRALHLPVTQPATAELPTQLDGQQAAQPVSNRAGEEPAAPLRWRPRGAEQAPEAAGSERKRHRNAFLFFGDLFRARLRAEGNPLISDGVAVLRAAGAEWRTMTTAEREPFKTGLKGSVGEGPNHSNHSNHSIHSNSFKIQEFSLENSKIVENFNIF